MSEWVSTKLGDVVDVRVSNVDKKSVVGEVPVRLCNYMDVYASNFVCASTAFMRATATKAEIERFRLLAGDVVITKDSESPDDIAVPTYVSEVGADVVCGYHLAILRPRGEVDGRFLSYLLRDKSVNRYFATRATGSTRYGLSIGGIKEAPISVPRCKAEQRRIANLLSAVDEQIALAMEMARKYETCRRGLLQRMLRQHPPSEQIGSHFQLRSGSTPSRARVDYYNDSGTPWVKTLDLNEGRIIATDERISGLALKSCPVTVYPPGTVLVAMYGGWEQIGRTAVLGVEACTNQAITALLPTDGDAWEPGFVLVALQALRHKWRKFAVSTRKDPNITKADVARFLLPRPSLDEQKAWSMRVFELDSLIAVERAKVEKMTLQKQALMQALLTEFTPATKL